MLLFISKLIITTYQQFHDLLKNILNPEYLNSLDYKTYNINYYIYRGVKTLITIIIFDTKNVFSNIKF